MGSGWVSMGGEVTEGGGAAGMGGGRAVRRPAHLPRGSFSEVRGEGEEKEWKGGMMVVEGGRVGGGCGGWEG